MGDPATRRFDAVALRDFGRQLRLARLAPFIPRLVLDQVLLQKFLADGSAKILRGARLPFLLDLLKIARDRCRAHPELARNLGLRVSLEMKGGDLLSPERVFKRSIFTFLLCHDLAYFTGLPRIARRSL